LLHAASNFSATGFDLPGQSLARAPHPEQAKPLQGKPELLLSCQWHLQLDASEGSTKLRQ
jgi:hypothetical protein